MSTKNEELKTVAEDNNNIQSNNKEKNDITIHSPTSLPPPLNVSETKENDKDNGTITVEIRTTSSPSVDIHPRRLTCYFTTEDGNGEMIPDVSNKTEKVFFLQEEGKKSSFLLEPGKDNESASPFYTVQKPANIVIEHNHGTFFLGGFQLIATAKSVEIYLTDKDGKETYLTTCKAITFNKEDTTAPWHKAICVVPGGPRNILRIRIKLLSLRPSEATSAKVQFMKLTARIAEPPSPASQSNLVAGIPSVTSFPAVSSPFTPSSIVSSSPSTPKTFSVADPPAAGNTKTRNVFFTTPETTTAGHPHFRKTAPPNSSAPLTQSDLGAAMAGVSFMARSTEKGVEDALHEHAIVMEKHFNTLSSKTEKQIHSLQHMLVVQQKIILENHGIMKRQQETIEDQGAQLRDLLKLQEDLKVRVQSLQADMTVIRYQRLDSNHRNRVEKGSTKDNTPFEQPPCVLKFDTQVRNIEDSDDGDIDEVNSGIVDEPFYIKEELYEQNIHLKQLIRRTTQETDQRAVTCGPMVEPKSVGCCALQLPGDNSDINEVGSSIIDEPFHSEEEFYQQNIHIKNLIQRTALEMDQRQASSGSTIEPKAVGFAPLQLPDDRILFNGVMLSNEEFLYKQMTEMRLSKGGQMEMEPAEPEEQCEKNDDEEDEDGYVEGCVNIEVTLVDEDERQEVEEHGEERPTEPEVLEMEGGEEEDVDEDATVTTVNMKKDGLEIPLDEKKEMDPSDTPDIQALIVGEKAEKANPCSITNPLSSCGTSL